MCLARASMYDPHQTYGIIYATSSPVIRLNSPSMCFHTISTIPSLPEDSVHSPCESTEYPTSNLAADSSCNNNSHPPRILQKLHFHLCLLDILRFIVRNM